MNLFSFLENIKSYIGTKPTWSPHGLSMIPEGKTLKGRIVDLLLEGKAAPLIRVSWKEKVMTVAKLDLPGFEGSMEEDDYEFKISDIVKFKSDGKKITLLNKV